LGNETAIRLELEAKISATEGTGSTRTGENISIRNLKAQNFRSTDSGSSFGAPGSVERLILSGPSLISVPSVANQSVEAHAMVISGER
jgi:hypothetical protein